MLYFFIINLCLTISNCENLTSKVKFTSNSSNASQLSIGILFNEKIHLLENSTTSLKNFSNINIPKEEKNSDLVHFKPSLESRTSSSSPSIDRVVINFTNVNYTKPKESKAAECCKDYQQYVVSLRRANPLTSELFIHVCVGVLLTRNIVLCSAHCLYDRRGHFIDDPDFYRVVVGQSLRSPFTPGIIVREIVLHNEYLPYIRRNDVALVKLDYQLPISTKPMIDKMNFKDLTNNDNCSQIFLSSSILGSDALQEGYKISIHSAKIMHWMVCMKLYEKWGIFISHNQLCATKQEDCSIDDGSILICNNELAGILSFRNNERGFKFYSDILPDVFTATSKYQYYLKSQIYRMNKGTLIKISNNVMAMMLLNLYYK